MNSNSNTASELRCVDRSEFTVGWICALAVELAACQLMIEEEYAPLEKVVHSDANAYTLGRIGGHHVVIACLPSGSYGLTSAAAVLRDVLASFPNVRFCFMVGIGGAAPSEENDIRLGDVVVGEPNATSGGVIQYDLGQATTGGFRRTGSLNQPPQVLLTALTQVKAMHMRGKTNMPAYVAQAPPKFLRPKTRDILFASDCVHVETKVNAECQLCDQKSIIVRQDRDSDSATVHYGLIASGNQVIKDAMERDRLREEHNIMCFEMEAAGMMNSFPCIVIRGICDYSDSHKHKVWQYYAATTAAAFARELLEFVQGLDVQHTPLARDITEKVEAVSSLMNGYISSACRDKFQSDVVQWLSPPDVSTNYRIALRKRQVDTGTWFLEHDTFDKWKNTNSSFLWLFGIPGCGKTVLSSAIIEHLSASDAYSIILYFFFDFQDQQKRKKDSMIRSLLLQLCSSLGCVPPALELLFKNCKDSFNTQQPFTDDLESALKEDFKTLQGVYVILDAIDECDNLGEMLGFISALTEPKIKGLHSLVTSRKEGLIEEYLSDVVGQTNQLSLRNNMVDRDIETYIRTRIQTEKALETCRKTPSIQQEVQETLTNKANGMFQWAACQLDLLRHCVNENSIRNTLNTLPATLHETYERILTNINLQHRQDVHHMLMWLTFSLRPLSETEFAEVSAFSGNCEFDEANRISPVNALMLCASLISTYRVNDWGVVLDPEDNSENNDSVVKVRLAHFSIKEFLVSHGTKWSIDPTEAHATIAKSSLSCLNQYTSDKCIDTFDFTYNYPLAEYAARYWNEHFLSGKVSNARTALQLFLHADRFENWKSIHDLLDSTAPTHLESYKNCSLLDYAVATGIAALVYEICKVLLQPFEDDQFTPSQLQPVSNLTSPPRMLESIGLSEEENDSLNQALRLASQLDLIDVAKVLLAYGADPNEYSGLEPGSAMSIAAKAGSKELMQLLLDKSVEDSAEDRGSNTPVPPALARKSALYEAAKWGQSEVVEFLLKKGFPPNERYQSNTALHAVSLWSFHISHSHRRPNLKRLICTAGVLLDYGVDMEAINDEGLTSLCLAARGGNVELVKLLVDYGAAVDGGVDCTRTPLMNALLARWRNVVDELLLHGADFSIQEKEKEKGTLLSAAIDMDHKGVVFRLLQDKDMDYQDNSPLLEALRRSDDDIACMLLQHGANPNDTQTFTTADGLPSWIEFATPVGGLRELFSDSCDYLGYSGLPSGLQDDQQREQFVIWRDTALWVAAATGCSKAVRVLLEKGASVDEPGPFNLTAAMIAAETNRPHLVRLLAQAGADITFLLTSKEPCQNSESSKSTCTSSDEGATNVGPKREEEKEEDIITDQSSCQTGCDVAAASYMYSRELVRIAKDCLITSFVGNNNNNNKKEGGSDATSYSIIVSNDIILIFDGSCYKDSLDHYEIPIVRPWWTFDPSNSRLLETVDVDVLYVIHGADDGDDDHRPRSSSSSSSSPVNIDK